MKEPKVGTEYIIIPRDYDISRAKKIVVDKVDDKYFYAKDYKFRKLDLYYICGDYSGYWIVLDFDWIESLYNKFK